ncbi:acyltransferase [Mesorhizobium sp. SARCC-RB16n]|uniref:acyltransferase family protein n=1 Tax=Mesorhizobium sp. SARCC-RB16n TaxID=2116687 RepID=UPI001663CD6A
MIGGIKLRLHALTGLRFLAAFTIVLHHLRGSFGIPTDISFAWRADIGVTVFFILSGFVLTYSYSSLGSGRVTVWQFYVARFARIWPAHAVTLLAAIALGVPFQLQSFIANAALVQAWIPTGHYFFSYNAVSWSISTEMGFYLLFPLLVLNIATTWPWKLAAALGISVAVVTLACIIDLPAYSGRQDVFVMQGLVMTNPLARLFEFTLGTATAAVWLRNRDRLSFSLVTWAGFEALSILFFIWGTRVIGSELQSIFPTGLSMEYWIGQSLSPNIPIAVALAVLASSTGPLARLLGSRPMIFLGEISFAIYLTHQLVLRFFLGHLQILEGWSPSVATAGYLTAVLVASTLLHFLVELPAQNAIKELAIRLRGHRIPNAGSALPAQGSSSCINAHPTSIRLDSSSQSSSAG